MAVYPPGLRVRHTREALGLTYRDVEKASYEIAVKRGRQEFILHISRLADIENRNVVPTLHKLYSLSTILHLDPVEISAWYEAPFHQTFHDGADFPPPRTHLGESFLSNAAPEGFVKVQFFSENTNLLNGRPPSMAPLPSMPSDEKTTLKTMNGRASTIAQCTSWNYARDTAAAGFRKTNPD